ncbi:putative neutral ceramidase superfamily lipid hydrolase [Pseudomonas sp. JAI120]|uniref:hypothetical protein n=2 Tax=Pseudomonas TaxID=286 RepID=UPI00161E24C9|nr:MULTISPECIES: hypothetical protein [unclassified Pseudomonas]MBB6286935.1 putative neutral ceramidase superfamily lipid hydrolase [Pseudomonas sp. SJZ073]MBB6311139.1 putative neutral ceramidase superfamily lipid hydrolase [Pseudomonas sp. JAI120]
MMRAELAQYGGITVMIPAALVIAVWLRYSTPWALRAWIITLGITYSIVAASKLLFKGWGLSFQHLDIAVISGHAMNTCLMVTVATSVLARQFNLAWRWPAALAGSVISIGFSAYCVAPYIHPLNEALAGAALGATAAIVFLWRVDAAPIKVSPAFIGGGLVFLLVCALVPKYNAELLLNRVAVILSGADQAHQEPAWRLETAHRKAE